MTTERPRRRAGSPLLTGAAVYGSTVLTLPALLLFRWALENTTMALRATSLLPVAIVVAALCAAVGANRGTASHVVACVLGLLAGLATWVGLAFIATAFAIDDS